MKHLVWLLLTTANIVAPAASAQPPVSEPQACEQRCRSADLDGPGVLPYNQKLAQIRDLKKLEKHPAKRKLLDEEEARANERRDFFVGRQCRTICTGR